MAILESDRRSIDWASTDTPSDVSRHAPRGGHAQAIWHDLPVAAREVVTERPSLGRLLTLLLSTNPARVLCPGLIGTAMALGSGAVW